MDCEIIGYDFAERKILPFNFLQKLKDNNEELNGSRTIKIIAFDIIYLNSNNMIGFPLNERKEELSKIKFNEESILEIINYSKINFANSNRKAQLEDLYNQARSKRNEGLMIKEWHKDSVYLPGTRKLWYKLKSFSDAYLDSLDLILVGAYKGEV